jgi:hypothetical protein
MLQTLLSFQLQREQNRWEIVTVTGVLTVSDQFAGSAYIQDASGAAVLIKQFMVLDYLK